MSGIDFYISNIEDVTLPAMRKELELFKSGQLRSGKREVSGPWNDTTNDQIQRVRRAIAEYESILAALRKGEVP